MEITTGPRSLPTKKHTKKALCTLKRPHGTVPGFLKTHLARAWPPRAVLSHITNLTHHRRRRIRMRQTTIASRTTSAKKSNQPIEPRKTRSIAVPSAVISSCGTKNSLMKNQCAYIGFSKVLEQGNRVSFTFGKTRRKVTTGASKHLRNLNYRALSRCRSLLVGNP